MARDLIKIKGVSNGFQLMVDSSADLAQVQEELERKLAEHPEFFPEGTKFRLVVADLHKSVRQGLGSYLQSKGLDLADSTKKVSTGAVRPNTGHANAIPQPNNGRNEGDCQQVMKVINRTVRNGEEITSQGSLIYAFSAYWLTSGSSGERAMRLAMRICMGISLSATTKA